MKTYILTLLAASIAAAVIQLLAPKGEGGKLGEHIRMITGLFLLVSLLTPLKEGIALLRSAAEGELSEHLTVEVPDGALGDYAGVFGDTLSFVGQEEVKAWVVSELETRFGIPSSGCRVSVTCAVEEECLTVSEVRIALRGGYVTENPHPIESRVTEVMGCPCYVTVEFSEP
jgi:hypothetical protein